MADDWGDQTRAEPEAPAGRSASAGIRPDLMTPNRDKRREPPMIELKADRLASDAPEPPPAAPTQEAEPGPAGDPPQPPADAPRRRWRALGPLVVLGAAAIALAGVIGFFVLSGQDDAATLLKSDIASLQSRVGDLEEHAKTAASATEVAALATRIAGLPVVPAGATQALAARLQALDKRLAVVEAAPAAATGGLDRRLAALEVGSSALSEAVGQAKAKAQAADAAASRAVAAAAAARTPGAAVALPPPVDVAPLDARLDRLERRVAGLEATLAVPKDPARITEARAEAPSSAAVSAGLAVAAQALSRALADGVSYGPELAALEAQGANGERLAALRPFAADGAPGGHQLATTLKALAPVMSAGPGAAAPRGFLGRLAADASGLVSIRRVGDAGGGAASPRIEDIAADLERGAFSEAAAQWEKLPSAARKASQQWANLLAARIAADVAARALLADAVAALGKPKS